MLFSFITYSDNWFLHLISKGNQRYFVHFKVIGRDIRRNWAGILICVMVCAFTIWARANRFSLLLRVTMLPRFHLRSIGGRKGFRKMASLFKCSHRVNTCYSQRWSCSGIGTFPSLYDGPGYRSRGVRSMVAELSGVPPHTVMTVKQTKKQSRIECVQRNLSHWSWRGMLPVTVCQAQPDHWRDSGCLTFD